MSKLQSPSGAQAGLAPTRDAFDRYLSELQALPLLDARQEIALAREIEARVAAHWQAVLSYRPAVGLVITAVGAALGSSGTSALASLRKLGGARARGIARRRAHQIERTARRLAELDVDGAALSAADAAVREAFAEDARARAYLRRVELARRAKLHAKGRFVSANLRLVITVARRYDRGLLPLADLIQEGNLGLMRAVDRFDHRRGFRFSTYASWWIRHHVTRALADKARLVRVPVHALDDISRVTRAVEAAKAQAGAAPSIEQIASATGMAADKVELLERQGRVASPVSLDHNLGQDREQTLHDVLADDQPDLDTAIDLDAWRALLEELLAELTPIEATTLRLRFGLHGDDELKLREIGAKYNLSRERIRQIQGEALAKLRATLVRRRREHDVAA